MNDTMNPQPPAMEQPPEQPQPSAHGDLDKLVQQFNAGAGFFYFIAVFSIINSVIILVGKDWAFFMGLGITQVIDAMGMAIADVVKEEAGEGPGVWIVRGVAFLFDIGVAGFFVLFGWLAKKGYGAAFIIGIIIYFFDALIFLPFAEWGGLIWHGIALFVMISGYSALRKLRAIQAQQAMMQ